MTMSEMIDQITPQHWEDPPYLRANTLASDELTFRRIKSSHYQVVSAGRPKTKRVHTISQALYSPDMTPINSYWKKLVIPFSSSAAQQ